ncbi:restriction endonuclease subunit S [Shewanella algae]|uniref:restriction endonuclease subunit S n=1 Tax=Shewanella algae TaxID=38313 RepID=UPI001AACEEA4|nr:restriction endonuclease subunit S [Shewanella algae]MBO2601461.1 restriction endonuclease subunit S [Shewanella algae]HEI5025419.1 restriction endonuclease subunit S [Escherichia coli]
MSSFSAYQAFDSDSFPEHWQVRRLRFAMKLNPSKKEVPLSDSELVSFVPMDAVGENGGIRLDEHKELGDIGSGYTYFRDNDVVVAKITPCFENGKGAIAKGLTNGCAFGTTELHVLRADLELLEPNFLFYLTVSDWFRDLGESEMYGAGGQKRVPEDFIKNLVVGIPSKEEQKAIAGFLDRKTAQIDALIAKKQALLEKLAEQRTALISQAVTKGLDPSVPMKDSGVDWLGEIPAHWSYKRLKFLVAVQGGGTPNTGKPEYWNGDIPWVSPKDMKYDFIDTTEDYLTQKGVEESATRLINSNAVLIVVRSGILRHTIPVARNTCLVSLNQDMKALTTNTELNPGYLHWFINGLQKGLLPLWSKPGCTVESIELNYLLNTHMPLPPHDEQQQIEDYVADIRDDFNNRMAKVEKVIQKLNEYRSALITNAVTGKIDVRDFCIPTTTEQREVAHG